MFKIYFAAVYILCGVAFVANKGMPCYREEFDAMAFTTISLWPVTALNHHYLGTCGVK